MAFCLVTGGAKRLGAEICRTLAQEKYNIVIHYRTSEKDAQRIVEECHRYGVTAEKIQGDFSTPHSTQVFIDNYLHRFSETTHLINNVGNYSKDPLLSLSDSQWLELYQTNFHAPFSLIRALLPTLQSVINMGMAGLDAWRTDPHSSAYRMTKMGLWMVTRSLARELSQKNVRVNMISPGQLENSIEAPTPLPMGRPGTFQEVSEVVLFLLKHSYITGQNIEVAGGLKL